MSRPRVLIAVLLSLTVALAGCSKDDKSRTPLLSGATLVSDAAAKARAVQSAHIKIDTSGDVTGLPFRRAEGDLLRSGDSKGTIQLLQLGVPFDYEFVLVGKDVYLKGVTGGFQKVQAATVAGFFDPTAILDPERGIAKLLATATDPVTEAQEKVDGKDAYRVAVKLDNVVVSALLPNAPAGVTSKVWIDANTKDLIKAVLTVPSKTAGKTGTVTISESNVDVPVTVSAP